jgi:D-glycero-alpha-D-manno-heptose-7-phosphate kinase
MIVSKTPLRISFAGGGTDFPSFYRSNEYGAVLSTSIDKYIYVTIKKHTRFFGERFRLNYSETELIDNIEDIKNPIIKECLRFLDINDRIYISTVADVPGSSGLGSSSSFCVGLLNALYKYKGETISAGRLAEEAAHIEIDVLERPIGKQDHYAAAFGGLNYIRFNSDESVTIRPITPNGETLEKLFSALISFWTGISRPAETILKEQDEKNEENSDILICLRNQAEELMNLIYHDDLSIQGFGKILDDGWQLKRKLASKISNSAIDFSYATAIKNGAIGGKISGAGGGGFLNLVASESHHGKIREALQAEGLMPCKFNMDSAGTTVTQLD